MSDSNNSSGNFSPTVLIGMGLAAFCSWQLHQSIGWACIHAIFGWFYLLYLCAGFGGGFPAGIW